MTVPAFAFFVNTRFGKPLRNKKPILIMAGPKSVPRYLGLEFDIEFDGLSWPQRLGQDDPQDSLVMRIGRLIGTDKSSRRQEIMPVSCRQRSYFNPAPCLLFCSVSFKIFFLPGFSGQGR